MNTLESIITQAWNERENLSPESHGPMVDAINEALTLLDSGQARVVEKIDDVWQVNSWLKKAVLLSFRSAENKIQQHDHPAFDKVPLKFDQWQESDFLSAGFRVVPGAIVRRGSFIGKDCVLMPSFTNIGAYIDEKTMIDSYATVGSCVQIGKNCHIASGVVLGGVLEPIQAQPVIIEDNVFVGAQAAIVEGAIIGEGAVIGMGVHIGAKTPILNRETGEVTYGQIPPYSVVVPGARKSEVGITTVQTGCAVIVKQVTAQTRSNTEINELLRA